MGSSRRSSPLRRTVPALAMIGAVTVAAAVGGCSRSRPPRTIGVSPSEVSVGAKSLAQARSVIAQDAATLRWSWLMGRAEAQLAAQCMKRLGFTYSVPVPDPEPSPATITVDAIGSGGPVSYGVFPRRERPSTPQGDRPSFEHAMNGGPTAQAVMTLPDGSTVTYGTGGCSGDARRSLFGSVRIYVASAYVPQVVRDEFGAFLTTDAPYTRALKAWQSCMRDRHWSFGSPAAAISSLENPQLSVASLRQRQAAIAGADRGCDSQSHLRARRSETLTRFTAGLSRPVLAELGEIFAGRERAGLVARRTLSP